MSANSAIIPGSNPVSLLDTWDSESGSEIVTQLAETGKLIIFTSTFYGLITSRTNSMV
jgi:hypothetical protein